MTIFTLYCNRPDFIRIQKDCFDKHLKDEFNWVVVNNSYYGHDKPEQIERVAAEENLECWRIKHVGDKPEASGLVRDSLIFLWNRIRKLKGKVIIMDSDLFLTEDVSFEKLLDGYDMFFCPNYTEGIVWPWPGLMGFNMDTIKADEISFDFMNFSGKNGDVGSGVGSYIQKYKPRINLIDRKEIIRQDWPTKTGKTLYEMGFPDPYSVDFLPFAFHYKTSSNYAKHCTPEYNEKKTKALLNLLYGN